MQKKFVYLHYPFFLSSGTKIFNFDPSFLFTNIFLLSLPSRLQGSQAKSFLPNPDFSLSLLSLQLNVAFLVRSNFFNYN